MGSGCAYKKNPGQIIGRGLLFFSVGQSLPSGRFFASKAAEPSRRGLLVKESGLLVGNAQLAVNGGKDALYLSEGEHAAE